MVCAKDLVSSCIEIKTAKTLVLPCIRDIAKQKVKSRTQGLLVFRKCHFGCAVIFVCPKLSLHFYFRWGNSSVIGSQNSLPHRCGKMHLNVSVLALPECMGRAEFHRWGKQIFSAHLICSTLSNLLLSTMYNLTTQLWTSELYCFIQLWSTWS